MTDGFSGNLEAVTAITRRYQRSKLIGTLYAQSPLYAFLAGGGWQKSTLGRPGVAEVIGPRANGMTEAEKLEIAGSTELHFPVQFGTSTGGDALMTQAANTNPYTAYVGATPATLTGGADGAGNAATSGTSVAGGGFAGQGDEVQNIGDFISPWGWLKSEVEVNKTTVLSARGQYAVLQPFKVATGMAVDRHVDKLSSYVWNDVPAAGDSGYTNSGGFTTTPAGVPAALIGLGLASGGTVALGTGSMQTPVSVTNGAPAGATLTGNAYKYLGVDMSQTNTATVQGTRITDSTPTNLDLIDVVNIDLGVRAVGPGIDLVLLNNKSYHTMKRQAINEGGTIIHNGEVPGFGTLGYKKEIIHYGGVNIVMDPKAPAGCGAFLTLDSWLWVTRPGQNSTLENFKELTIPGMADCFYGYINTGWALICDRPRLNVFYTRLT
jgi:hypothetical protein